MSVAIKAARRGRASGYPARAIVRGDPGLFGFLGKAAKAAVGFIPGVGPAISAGLNAISGGGSRPTVSQAVAGPVNGSRQILPPIRMPGGLQLQAPVAFSGPSSAPVTKAQADKAACKAMSCPSGYHPNKADYFLSSGEFVPAGSRCVKNRRRNPLNPRALDRSLSRVASTGKAVRALGFTPISARKVAQAGKKPSRRRKK